MPHALVCPECRKPRRRGLWLPPRFRRGAVGDWRITASGNPLLADGGGISIGEDCCCCRTCCDVGTAPPQIEIDTTGIVPNPFLGCETGCNSLEGVFLADFRSLGVADVGVLGTGLCAWRYCGEMDCPDPTPFGWDVYIFSTGTACRAQAFPWIETGGCDDFTYAAHGGTDANYFADLPTDPDDCCDALSSPFTLDPDPVVGGPASVFGAPGGCQILSFLANSITIQAVGC